MSLEPHCHNSKLSNLMQSARYVSLPVTELQQWRAAEGQS